MTDDVAASDADAADPGATSEGRAEAAAAAYRSELAGVLSTGTVWIGSDGRRRDAASVSKRWWRRRRRSSGQVPAGEVEAELRMKNAAARSAESDVTLKKVVGYGALAFMVVQIAVADTVFFVYGRHNGWAIPSEVIDFWLGATVVQVAVIVRTVATYLFPASGGR